MKQRINQSVKYLSQTSSFPTYFIHQKSCFLLATGNKGRPSLFQGSTYSLSSDSPTILNMSGSSYSLGAGRQQKCVYRFHNTSGTFWKQTVFVTFSPKESKEISVWTNHNQNHSLPRDPCFLLTALLSRLFRHNNSQIIPT